MSLASTGNRWEVKHGRKKELNRKTTEVGQVTHVLELLVPSMLSVANLFSTTAAKSQLWNCVSFWKLSAKAILIVGFTLFWTIGTMFITKDCGKTRCFRNYSTMATTLHAHRTRLNVYGCVFLKRFLGFIVFPTNGMFSSNEYWIGWVNSGNHQRNCCRWLGYSAHRQFGQRRNVDIQIVEIVRNPILISLQLITDIDWDLPNLNQYQYIKAPWKKVSFFNLKSKKSGIQTEVVRPNWVWFAIWLRPLR